MKYIFSIFVVAILAIAGSATANTPFSGTLLLGASSTQDTGTQLLIGNSFGTVPTGTDQYIPLGFTNNPSGSDTLQGVFPAPGAVKSFLIEALVPPSGVTTYLATLMINGVAASPSCTMTLAAPICEWLGSYSVVAGDYAAIKIHTSGSPLVASTITTTVGWTPTTVNDTLITGGAITGTFSTSVSNVIRMFDGAAPGTNSSATKNHIYPDGGTVSKLYVVSVAPGTLASGKSYAYTMLNSITATALTTTISDNGTANADITHSYSVSAGNFAQLQAVPTSSPTASNATFGILYQPTTVGSFAYFGGFGSIPASGVWYNPLTSANGGATGGQTNEDLYKGITRSQTITKIQGKVANQPGAGGSGKSITLKLRVNKADTALVCTFFETQTTCNGTGSIVVNDRDYVDVSMSQANGPNGTSIGYSLLANR